MPTIPNEMPKRLLAVSFIVPFAVVALAAGLRFWRLSWPDQTIADESYYAFDASNYLGGGVSFAEPPGFPTIEDESTWIHPPLGKELIALGVGPLGMRPLGWRLPPAAFGTLGVLFVYLLALELWGSVWWAGLAGLLVTLDGLHIVQSRLAMLDIFVATFVTAGAWFLVRDRNRWSDEPPAGRIALWFGSRDRLLAGVAFGAAGATKWAGALALAFAIPLAVVWLRRRPRALRTVATSLVAVPIAVYFGSYFPFWLEHGPAIGAFANLQRHMLDYHLHLAVANPLASSPASWPTLVHPMRAFPAAKVPLAYGAPRIIALGNPALWWGFLASVLFLAYLLATKRDWHDVLVAVGYLSVYAPWFAFSRTQYFYYMTPAVAFMALAVVAVLRRVPERARRAAGVASAAAATLTAVAFLPIWLGLRVPLAWMHAIRWLPTWH